MRSEVAKRVVGIITEKKINVKSAIDLVKIAMQEVEKMKDMSGAEKQKLVINVLTEVAEGEDGIIGTADDLIPEHVLAGIKALLEHDLVPAMVNIIIDASHGRLDINNVKGCFTSLVDCLAGYNK